jgi:hypothetical protein
MVAFNRWFSEVFRDLEHDRIMLGSGTHIAANLE